MSSEKFRALRHQAEGLTDIDVAGRLHSLTSDDRFSALIAVLLTHKEAYSTQGCDQGMATFHASLAHCQGSIWAINRLLEEIEAAMEAPKPRKQPGPVQASSD